MTDDDLTPPDPLAGLRAQRSLELSDDAPAIPREPGEDPAPPRATDSD